MANRSQFPLVICAAALSVLVVLSACQPSDTGAKSPPTPDTCGLSKYDTTLGTPVKASDFSAAKLVRIIPPGTAITMDYRAERLNVETDAAGVITRLYCG